jgi:hypothetical protein
MRNLRFTLLLVAGCHGSDERFDKIWKGIEGVIRSPMKVEAYRITKPKPELENLHLQWLETAGPVTLDVQAVKELAEIFLDIKTYKRGVDDGCLPTPGVKLRFARDHGEPVWVFLCFECDVLIVYDGPTRRGADSFHPVTPALRAIVKKLFPNDPLIQALK